MKTSGLQKAFFLLCSAMLALTASSCDVEPTGAEYFIQAWTDFDQNYSYFSHKDVDWDEVWVEYAPKFAVPMSGNEFAEELNSMLQVLHDWHVAVQKPDGQWLGYNGTVTENYPSTLDPHYTLTGSYAEVGSGVIYHAWLTGNIAYIDIETFDTASFSSVSDRDIEDLFTTYASAAGMIIDIRANSGGNEANALKIASRFTGSPLTYGYVRYRNGPGHDDFDDPVEKILQPSSETGFSGPAVCLIGQHVMSSGEWFTLMMKACPNATLIGDRTRGASGNPKEFTLANGVTYLVSSWVACTYYDKIIEDNGIEPDIFLSPGASYDDDHDYVLETALEYLGVE